MTALAACSGEPPAAPKPARAELAPPPNIVVLVLDALRADRFWAARNGKPVCPFLTGVAGQGVVFDRAYSPCSWTKPSMASLFTGLDVDVHGVYFSSVDLESGAVGTDVLPDHIETMAEFFKDRGYQTAGIQTNGNLQALQGFDAGFDTYPFKNNPAADWPTDRALEALDALAPPYFLYVHYMDPHGPYTPPEAYREHFGPLPELTEADRAALAASSPYVIDRVHYRLGAKSARRFEPVSEAGREAFRMLYDADCRYMDAELERLFAVLEGQNTIVAVVADHGQAHWEHDAVGHGQTLYGETLDVPFFIRAPGLTPRRVTRPVSTQSLLPTLAAMAGFEPRSHWQGANLLADGAPAQPVYAVTYCSQPRFDVHIEAVVDGPLKLIADRQAGRFELYDVAADPRELADLAAPDQPETAATAAARLDALLVQRLETNLAHRAAATPPFTVNTPAALARRIQTLGLAPPEAEAAAAPQQELDAATLEVLRSQGYLE